MTETATGGAAEADEAADAPKNQQDGPVAPPNGSARPGSDAAVERLGASFAKLWAASTTSALGSGLSAVATPLLIASRTSNALVVAAASVFIWLPWLVFALPGGVLVDRLDRRRMMVVIDWTRVVALTILSTALITGHLGIALLYAVLFLINLGEVTFRSASQAFIPAVVPRSRLERANGWLAGGATFGGALIAGPIGGLLFAIRPSLPYVANAATYAVSAIFIGLIAGSYRAQRATLAAAGDHPAADPAGHVVVAPGPEGEPREAVARPSVWADMVGGLRWLLRQRLLRTMAILIGLLNVTLTAALAVLVLLAKQRLHLGSVGYGVLFTCLAIGGVAGSAVGDRIIAKFTATWTVRIGLLIEAAFHLVLATSRSPYVVGFAFVAFGVHGALWTIVNASLRQRMTPQGMQGRVASANLFLAAGGNCVGALLGGGLAKAYGIAAPYWVGFVVAVLVIAFTWRVFDRSSVATAYATRPDEA